MRPGVRGAGVLTPTLRRSSATIGTTYINRCRATALLITDSTIFAFACLFKCIVIQFFSICIILTLTLSLTGPDWAWLGLTGPGWAWLGLTGPDWAWLSLTGPDWAWLSLTEPDWAWLSLTEAVLCVVTTD